MTSNPIIPTGTEVVARTESRSAGGRAHPAGSVGIVVASPADGSHGYRVRFADGDEATFRREELAVLKHFQKDGMDNLGAILEEFDLYPYVIYRCIVGSRAYGLEGDSSDTDRRGVYLPPADLQWSLYGVPEQLENKETDEAYWEIRKFLILALKANPNILECLYTPLVETATPIGEELV